MSYVKILWYFRCSLMSSRDQICTAAKVILQQNPGGVRFADLRRRLKAEYPNLKENTVHGVIWNLDQTFPSEITKPERGLFMWIGGGTSAPRVNVTLPPRIREENFYQPFADWLVELDECTKAIPIGGRLFEEKWGTPDVMGAMVSRDSDIIKVPPQIVSAEIKTDTNQLIAAFGQACAYKLFSHKSYLVIPKNSDEEEIARVDSLCSLYGIGLVLFDSRSTECPDFEIRHRAARHEPDIFYANNYLRILAQKGKLFN